MAPWSVHAPDAPEACALRAGRPSPGEEGTPGDAQPASGTPSQAYDERPAVARGALLPRRGGPRRREAGAGGSGGGKGGAGVNSGGGKGARRTPPNGPGAGVRGGGVAGRPWRCGGRLNRRPKQRPAQRMPALNPCSAVSHHTQSVYRPCMGGCRGGTGVSWAGVRPMTCAGAHTLSALTAFSAAAVLLCWARSK